MTTSKSCAAPPASPRPTASRAAPSTPCAKNRPTTPNCVLTPSLTASAKCARPATPPVHCTKTGAYAAASLPLANATIASSATWMAATACSLRRPRQTTRRKHQTHRRRPLPKPARHPRPERPAALRRRQRPAPAAQNLPWRQLERRQIPQTGRLPRTRTRPQRRLAHQQQTRLQTHPLQTKLRLACRQRRPRWRCEKRRHPAAGWHRALRPQRQTIRLPDQPQRQRQCLRPQPRPLPHLQLQPRNHRRARPVDEHQ